MFRTLATRVESSTTFLVRLYYIVINDKRLQSRCRENYSWWCCFSRNTEKKKRVTRFWRDFVAHYTPTAASIGPFASWLNDTMRRIIRYLSSNPRSRKTFLHSESSWYGVCGLYNWQSTKCAHIREHWSVRSQRFSFKGLFGYHHAPNGNLWANLPIKNDKGIASARNNYYS